MEPITMAWAVLYGAGAGALRAAIGLWGKDPTQPLDRDRVLYTVLLGLIVGGGVALTGWQATEVELLVVNLGGTYLLHKVVRGVGQRIRGSSVYGPLDALGDAVDAVRADPELRLMIRKTPAGEALGAYLEGLQDILAPPEE